MQHDTCRMQWPLQTATSIQRRHRQEATNANGDMDISTAVLRLLVCLRKGSGDRCTDTQKQNSVSMFADCRSASSPAVALGEGDNPNILMRLSSLIPLRRVVNTTGRYALLQAQGRRPVVADGIVDPFFICINMQCVGCFVTTAHRSRILA